MAVTAEGENFVYVALLFHLTAEVFTIRLREIDE